MKGRQLDPRATDSKSLQALYEQRQAESQVKDLLSSEKPSAGVKAFATGMLAGSALPLALQTLPALGQVPGALDAARAQQSLAHMLQERGMPEAKARQAAAGAYAFLTSSPQHLPKDAEDILQSFRATAPKVRVGAAGEDVSPEVADALLEKKLKDVLGPVADSVSPQDKKVLLSDLRTQLGMVDVPSSAPASMRASFFPSADEAQSILDHARLSYIKSGKPDISEARVAADVLRSAAKRALPVAGLLGLVGGTTALVHQRHKKKLLKDLRASSKVKTAEDSLTDRALLTAPGVGAVLGGTAGAIRPDLFDPSSFVPAKGKGVHSIPGRIVAGVLGAGVGASTGWLPSVARDAYRGIFGSQNLSATPIVVQKQASVAGVDLRVLRLTPGESRGLFGELQKIAESQSGYSVSLKSNPWDLGIYAKKSGESDRGLAYGHALGTAAIAGAGAAAPVGAIIGRPAMSLLTESGRAGAMSDAASDIASVAATAGLAKAKATTDALSKITKDAPDEVAAVLRGIKNPEDLANALQDEKVYQRLLDKGVDAASEGIRGGLDVIMKSNLGDILKRRGKAALGVTLGGALSGAALQGLSNAGQYETARTLAGTPGGKK